MIRLPHVGKDVTLSIYYHRDWNRLEVRAEHKSGGKVCGAQVYVEASLCEGGAEHAEFAIHDMLTNLARTVGNRAVFGS